MHNIAVAEDDSAPEFSAKDKPYLKMLTDGLRLRDAGQKRQAADLLLRAYRGRGKAWWCRNLLLNSYTDLFASASSTGMPPSDADMRALREISRDATLALVERTHAQYTFAISLWALGDTAASVKANKRLIEMAARATPEERAAPCITAFNREMCRVPASRLIDKDVERAKHNLIVFDPYATENPPPPEGVGLHHRHASWPIPTTCETPYCGGGPAAVRRACTIRSKACSQCGTSAGEAQLSCCSKCKLAYYCSSKCQRANWAAHKPQCRAPGEHYEGDVVQLQLLRQRPDLNGQFFRVLERDPDKAGRWRVENAGLSALLSVRQENMQRVLWH